MTVSEAGRKGGRARAAKLSEHRRKEIARLGYIASPISKSHRLSASSISEANSRSNKQMSQKIVEESSCA